MNVNGRGTAVTDRAGLEVLAREVFQLLAEAPIGRIVFTDHALPAVQPVNFAMLGTDIIIRTSPESKLRRPSGHGGRVRGGRLRRGDSHWLVGSGRDRPCG